MHRMSHILLRRRAVMDRGLETWKSGPGAARAGNASDEQYSLKKRAVLEGGWKPRNLVSISGAYFESPRRYLLSLYLQGRAPLTLTTACSMHCCPFSIACCHASDALVQRWQADGGAGHGRGGSGFGRAGRVGAGGPGGWGEPEREKNGAEGSGDA